MTVPYVESMMLPILKIVGDLKEHSMTDISEAPAKQFPLVRGSVQIILKLFIVAEAELTCN